MFVSMALILPFLTAVQEAESGGKYSLIVNVGWLLNLKFVLGSKLGTLWNLVSQTGKPLFFALRYDHASFLVRFGALHRS
jgi:hypothetical protein